MNVIVFLEGKPGKPAQSMVDFPASQQALGRTRWTDNLVIPRRRRTQKLWLFVPNTLVASKMIYGGYIMSMVFNDDWVPINTIDG